MATNMITVMKKARFVVVATANWDELAQMVNVAKQGQVKSSCLNLEEKSGRFDIDHYRWQTLGYIYFL